MAGDQAVLQSIPLPRLIVPVSNHTSQLSINFWQEKLILMIDQCVYFSRRRSSKLIISEGMSRIVTSVVAILLLAAIGHSFTLEGTWQYQLNPGSTTNQPVTLKIEDFIYREGTILQKLTFKGCRQILLQAQFN